MAEVYYYGKGEKEINEILQKLKKQGLEGLDFLCEIAKRLKEVDSEKVTKNLNINIFLYLMSGFVVFTRKLTDVEFTDDEFISSVTAMQLGCKDAYDAVDLDDKGFTKEAWVEKITKITDKMLDEYKKLDSKDAYTVGKIFVKYLNEY